MNKLDGFPVYIKQSFGKVIAFIFGQGFSSIILNIKTVRPHKFRTCGLCTKSVEKSKMHILLECATAKGKRYSIYLHLDCYEKRIEKLTQYMHRMHEDKLTPDDIKKWIDEE